MPHPGHLCISSKCQFHLNTWVGKHIVSTVGEYWPERRVREIHAEIHDPAWFKENGKLMGDHFDYAYMKRFGFEDVGAYRKYETMVFLARPSEVKEKDFLCCPYEAIADESLDFLGYKTATEAYQGHLKMCEKWC